MFAAAQISSDGPMPSLEEDIQPLKQLHELRKQCIDLRDQAILAITSEPYGDQRARWQPRGDQVEQALVARAIYAARKDHVRLGKRDRSVSTEAVDALKLRLEDLYADSRSQNHGDDVPVLRAARVLQALATTPSGTFSTSAMVCYYRILRELYTADAPDWTTGGARAGLNGSSTAFVTGECVRAVLGVARALERTAELLDCFGTFRERRKRISFPRIPEAWRAQEKDRLELDLLLDLQRLHLNLLPLASVGKVQRGKLKEILETCPALFHGSATADVANITDAIKECEKYRTDEVALSGGDKERTARIDRSETAHRLGLTVMRDALERAQSLAQTLDKKTFDDIAWCELAKNFRDASKRVRAALRPASYFLQAVLHRELAATGQGTRADLPELAFAATAYGAMNDHWDHPHIRRAAELLMHAIGHDGTYPLGSPMQVDEKGYKLHAVGAEVIRAVAQLLRHVDVEIEPSFLRKTLQFFWDTRVNEDGWTHEHAERPLKSSWWVTSLVATALRRLILLLDERINAVVLRHFTKRAPKQLKVEFAELFYPDYGLAAHYPGGTPEKPAHVGIATLLLRMRAHLENLETLDVHKSLCSAVFYGPPGTGKTTLLEALAKAAAVPLVEVTPSDIVVGGTESAEGRARTVFEALSMLTDVVILFDEFEPVIQRRPDDRKDSPKSVFEFITPGMLPKLKHLHDAAEKQRVVFALATNQVGNLDEAAIREGRFDAKIGVYPPDMLSRRGRLALVVLEQLLEKKEPKLDEAFDALQDRLADVVKLTAKGPMTTLGKRGWYRAGLEDRRPLKYIVDGDESGRPPKQEPEKDIPIGPTPAKGDALREWQEWAWINKWEEKMGDDNSRATAGTLEKAAAAFPVERLQPSASK